MPYTHTKQASDEWILDVRDRAVDLIEQGWTRGELCQMADGSTFQGEDHETPGPEEGACSWCLAGAIFAALRDLGYPSADQHGPQYKARWEGFTHAWRQANGRTDTIVEFNDDIETDREQVLESLRRMT